MVPDEPWHVASLVYPVARPGDLQPASIQYIQCDSRTRRMNPHVREAVKKDEIKKYCTISGRGRRFSHIWLDQHSSVSEASRNARGYAALSRDRPAIPTWNVLPGSLFF